MRRVTVGSRAIRSIAAAGLVAGDAATSQLIAVSPSAAAGGTINSCTYSAVAAAVKAGGSWRFGC